MQDCDRGSDLTHMMLRLNMQRTQSWVSQAKETWEWKSKYPSTHHVFEQFSPSEKGKQKKKVNEDGMS